MTHPTPPVARKEPKLIEQLGRVRLDDYAWMKDDNWQAVLRDPLLPTPLLPADWPGRAARQLCGEIYRGLLPASEQWLDRSASNENGPLPAAGGELARRFGD